MIGREKLPSLSFPTGVSQVDTASREKATIAVIIFFCIISTISAVIFVIVNCKYCYDIILIAILSPHCLYCAQRDVSIKETTAQVLLGRVAIYTSAGAAEVLEIFTNDGKFKNYSKKQYYCQYEHLRYWTLTSTPAMASSMSLTMLCEVSWVGRWNKGYFN